MTGPAMAGPVMRLAITGTDTGVGKTVVACALVAALRDRGLRVGALKPVETGIAARDASTDGARLRHAAGDVDPVELVCPIIYDEPLAPWVAARRAGRPVDLARLDAAVDTLGRDRDALVVEGAGGLLVPFTRELSFADLARRWSLDVVIVAANRLGALNHTLLTLREAERRGLRVRAIALVAPVPNDADPIATASNAATLADLASPVPIVPIARVRPPDSLHDRQLLATLGAPLAATVAATLLDGH